jgi:hypothetical protein
LGIVEGFAVHNKMHQTPEVGIELEQPAPVA